MSTDLSDPIWTIDHVARAFHLSVDAAREHTYRDGFPRAKTGFAANLWLREEVMSWFTSLSGRSPEASTTRTVRRPARAAATQPRSTTPREQRTVSARPAKLYTPRPRG